MIEEINPSEPTYLVGSIEDDEFWCRGEFTCKMKAEAAYYHYCQAQPQKYIKLIEQTKVHKVVEVHYPE